MSKPISVAIIGTNGLPGRYGGWDQLMNHLTADLRDHFSFAVYTSSHDRVKGLKEVNGAKIEVVYLKANGFQSVAYDGWSMLHACFKYDVLLVLGTSGCIFLPLIKLLRKRIVLNPDGAEYNRKKWGVAVKKFLRLSEAVGVKFADAVISDNSVITASLLSDYGVKSELIAYGGDNASPVPLSKETADKYQIRSDDYAFKVCRIEPENNIDLILEAFSSTEYTLVLIGNWNFSNYGRAIREKYQSFKNLRLLDPIYEQEVLDEVRSNCRLYVHGHSVGGTNPSLVEAMSLALTCVVFDVDYNRETTENSAMYFSDSLQLREAVQLLFEDSRKRRSIGDQMYEIASRRYRWCTIVEDYRRVIENGLSA